MTQGPAAALELRERTDTRNLFEHRHHRQSEGTRGSTEVCGRTGKVICRQVWTRTRSEASRCALERSLKRS